MHLFSDVLLSSLVNGFVSNKRLLQTHCSDISYMESQKKWQTTCCLCFWSNIHVYLRHIGVMIVWKCMIIKMHLCLSCCCRLNGDSLQQDKDALLRKLMEAEEDRTAAAKQVSALRESVSKLCSACGTVSINSIAGPSWPGNLGTLERKWLLLHPMLILQLKMFFFFKWLLKPPAVDWCLCPCLSFCLLVKRLSGSESSVLAHQRELLLQKLETFESTNRTLRHLLREQQGSQVLCMTHLRNTWHNSQTVLAVCIRSAQKAQ